MPDSPPQLAHLEYLGDATRFASQMHALIPRCALLENFSPAEVLLLTHFMEMYRAEPGIEIIQEGDGGDFMLMVVEGKVEVQKRDRWNTQQTLAVVEGGGDARRDVDDRRRGALRHLRRGRADADRRAPPREPGAHHRRAAAARRQDPDGAGPDALSQRLRTTSQRLLGLLGENSQGAADVL